MHRQQLLLLVQFPEFGFRLSPPFSIASFSQGFIVSLGLPKEWMGA
jgi:hypothetical protein